MSFFSSLAQQYSLSFPPLDLKCQIPAEVHRVQSTSLTAYLPRNIAHARIINSHLHYGNAPPCNSPAIMCAERQVEPVLSQCVPRAVERKENRGGYECEFVERPPEAIQTECPVCLQILKEPCLISCGYKFCRDCIERVKKDDKPCPLCGEQDFTFMRELGLERKLKELEVWCSHKKEGCEWRGRLGKLEEHLNQEPSPESQLNGCEFVVVECMYKCGEWFQRPHIATHQNEQCKKRPYSCDYCRDYASTFEDVIGVHYPQCGKYPVACPNDCDVYKMERQDLEGHLRDKCPLALVDCPFNYASCETQLLQKDMPEHMKDTATHLTLLAIVTQRLSIENQRLMEENRQLQRKDDFQNTVKELRTLLQKLNEKQQLTEKEIEKLKKQRSTTTPRGDRSEQRRLMRRSSPPDWSWVHGVHHRQQRPFIPRDGGFSDNDEADPYN